ncbi:MAG: hypothetical protein ACT4N4_13305 [Rhodospirillales bacterium]
MTSMRRLGPALALALAVSGCGLIDRVGLVDSGKQQAERGRSSDGVPAGTLMGSVEADPPLGNANVRVELYDITGIDADEAVKKAEPVKVARSDRAGRYSFQLGSLAQAPAGKPKTWLVRAAPGDGDAAKTPEARVTFQAQYARGRLPPLYLWDGAATAETADRLVSFRFAALPAGKQVDQPVYGVELTSSAGGGPFLPFINGKPEIAVSRQALQELAWTWRPQASLEQRQADGTVFHAVYRGQPRGVAGGNPPPLTRLREAKLVPPGLAFLSLTDGRAENALPHQMPPGATVEIDLGTASEVGSVFLFGLWQEDSQDITVHLGNAAGRPGPALARAQAADAFEIRLPPGSAGRHLAVRFSGRLVALSEVVAYPAPDAQKWEAAKPAAPYSTRVDKAPVN